MMQNRILIIIFFNFIAVSCYSQLPVLSENTMVQKFYEIGQNNLYWFSSNKNIKRANEWLTAIEFSDNLGLASNKLQIAQIRSALANKKKNDIFYKEQVDKQITAIALNFIKELQQGSMIFDYDEVSTQNDSAYVYQLLNSKTKEPVSKIIELLDCNDRDYMILKKFLQDSISENNTLKYKAVIKAMNYRRYIRFNRQSEYIFVNIPSAEAEYYRNDSLYLKMKTVVGKKSKPTPTISSYITSIVTFPYWNVPHSIAVNELLHKVQENDNYLEQHNYEVVDSNSIVIEDSELNWKDYTPRNFPYYFRQSTGINNALGVLKFNLQNPFSIFLHSTSNIATFGNDYRFLSHGCIRLEKPLELADALLRGNIDIEELKNGKAHTKSKTIALSNKIPIFIIYCLAIVESGNVVFLKDVY